MSTYLNKKPIISATPRNTAHKRGNVAAQEGKTNCPYPQRSPSYQHWLDGYNAFAVHRIKLAQVDELQSVKVDNPVSKKQLAFYCFVALMFGFTIINSSLS